LLRRIVNSKKIKESRVRVFLFEALFKPRRREFTKSNISADRKVTRSLCLSLFFGRTKSKPERKKKKSAGKIGVFLSSII
jgi:hypothetical protein